jgi:RNA polymerase sigma-70 factor (ECF subfamily)
MWRVYAELSFKQIAGIFGKTENWACVTYHRARKKILDRLEEEKNEN